MLSRWPATAAVAGAIFLMSGVPPDQMPPVRLFRHADKLAHIIEYAALGVLLFRSLVYELPGRYGLPVMVTLAAGTLFGALDEWHQSFTGRTPDVWDVAADAAGLACGTLLVLLVRKWRTEK